MTRRRSDEDVRRALRRRRRQRRLRQGAAWMVVVGLSLGVGLGFRAGGKATLTWVRHHTRWLQVRAVDPGRTRSIPPWEVAEQATVNPGDDILRIDPDSVAARLQAHPRIAAARVRRLPDRRLRLEVRERVPLALFLGGTAVELDGTGRVLGPPPPTRLRDWMWPGADPRRGLALPLLSGVDLRALQPGERVEHPGVRRALAFLARLRLYGYDGGTWISEIRVDDPEDLVLYTLDQGIPVHLGEGRLSRSKILALFGVLEEIRSRRLRVARVDLRFRDQVVVRRG